jgi:hypothetical protein
MTKQELQRLRAAGATIVKYKGHTIIGGSFMGGPKKAKRRLINWFKKHG